MQVNKCQTLVRHFKNKNFKILREKAQKQVVNAHQKATVSNTSEMPQKQSEEMHAKKMPNMLNTLKIVGK